MLGGLSYMCSPGRPMCGHFVITSGCPPGTGCAPTQLWVLFKEKYRRDRSVSPTDVMLSPAAVMLSPQGVPSTVTRSGCLQAHPHRLQCVYDV